MKRIYNWFLNRFYRIRGRLFGWKSVKFEVTCPDVTFLPGPIPDGTLKAIQERVDREVLEELSRDTHPTARPWPPGYPDGLPNVDHEEADVHRP